MSPAARRLDDGRQSSTGQRSTRQRAAVIAALGKVDDFQSAQQMHAVLRDEGTTVGLTTVYRALQNLADAGEVDVLRRPDGEAVYRKCQTHQHHHHLVCRGCGLAIEIEGPEVEAWTEKVANSHGFHEVSHTIEIFGLCAACQT